jgi:hypothetical protein
VLDQLTIQLAALRSLDAEQVHFAVEQLVDEAISAEIKAAIDLSPAEAARSLREPGGETSEPSSALPNL